ncbi:hypothetical protein [Undibacterium sp. KW1]|uniref:hypothetical protein n=1 Tax=Undibacterium sp. KW1 TaxID=2058624 RepID=UPI001E462F5F|nr:hypothetical protein [Undibacterium sp. KW1]
MNFTSDMSIWNQDMMAVPSPCTTRMDACENCGNARPGYDYLLPYMLRYKLIVLA